MFKLVSLFNSKNGKVTYHLIPSDEFERVTLEANAKLGKGRVSVNDIVVACEADFAIMYKKFDSLNDLMNYLEKYSSTVEIEEEFSGIEY